MTLLPLLLAAACSALEIDHDPEAFIKRSAADPERIHALIIGAPWCMPCEELKKELAELQPSTAAPAGRVAWGAADSDALGDKLDDILARLGAMRPSTIPNVLILKGGKAVGHSVSGGELKRIETFLAEVEALGPSPEGGLPKLLCPGASDWATYTLGLSGHASSEKDTSTDDFGRKILLSFRSAAKTGPARLFAPAGRKAAMDRITSPSGEGLFYAPDQIAPHDALFSSLAVSTFAVADLKRAPGSKVRLILAGHAGESGMTVAFASSSYSGAWKLPVYLTAQELERGVRAARNAGKEVRGLAVTCYAGQFGDAFMPLPSPAAPACAAFATLPVKTSEGCYRWGSGTAWKDYSTTASKLLRCGSGEDGRDRHYAVVAATASRDVPMLSSEYFLIYGPAAKHLGRGADVPAPPRSIERMDLKNGVRVYFDHMNGRVLKALKDGVPTSPPRVALTGCMPGDSWNSLDKRRTSAAHLRARGAGRPQDADCRPLMRFYWEREDSEFHAEEESPGNGTLRYLYEPNSRYNYGRESAKEIAADFDGAPRLLADGLLPEARLALKHVLPAFSRHMKPDELEAALHKLAEDVSRHDRPLALALVRLVDAVKNVPPPDDGIRAVPKTSVAKSTETYTETSTAESGEDAWREVLSAASLSHEQDDKPATLNADELTAHVMRNLGPAEVEKDSIAYSRLAHLVTAAKAELALRAEAKTSKRAAELVTQLEGLKACERGLY